MFQQLLEWFGVVRQFTPRDSRKLQEVELTRNAECGNVEGAGYKGTAVPSGFHAKQTQIMIPVQFPPPCKSRYKEASTPEAKEQSCIQRDQIKAGIWNDEKPPYIFLKLVLKLPVMVLEESSVENQPKGAGLIGIYMGSSRKASW